MQDPTQDRQPTKDTTETKLVEVPMLANRSGRRAATKRINKYTQQGWTLQEIRPGGLLSRVDTAVLTRPVR